MASQVTNRPERWESMLTQGALRQRRRRALESAEERQERLARDAERKRIKRMRESAEEAAWRRTVDAMRKKEKRMKERIEKLEGRYAMGNAGKVEMDVEGNDPVLSYARSYSRRRRNRRTEVSDYLLFPDSSDFGGGVGRGYDLSNSLLESRLRGGHNSTPSTSSCCGGPVDIDGGSVDVGCASLEDSPCLRSHPTLGVLPGDSRGRVRRWRGTGSVPYGTRTDLSALSPEVIISELKLEYAEDDEEDVGISQSLSVLSPEVLIKEIKSESLDEEEEVETPHDHHISALSPEVIICEDKPSAMGDSQCGVEIVSQEGEGVIGCGIPSCHSLPKCSNPPEMHAVAVVVDNSTPGRRPS